MARSTGPIETRESFTLPPANARAVEATTSTELPQQSVRVTTAKMQQLSGQEEQDLPSS